MKSKLLIVLFLILTFFGCTQYGFIESQFNLSPESRLPKWFDIPPGYTRADLTMTVTYFSHPFFSKATMTVKGPAPEHKVITELVGDQNEHPITMLQPRTKYPKYITITVSGIREIFEHRAMEPIIYITDDPKVTGFFKEYEERFKKRFKRL